MCVLQPESQLHKLTLFIWCQLSKTTLNVVSIQLWCTISFQTQTSHSCTCTHIIIIKPHTRTVVWECYKGDESLWERGKSDPPPPKNPQPMVTKICVGDYVGDIYHHAKFYPNSFRGFGSAHAWFRAPRHKVTRLFFGGDGGSWERLPPKRAHRFWCKIRQTMRFRARKCLLGIVKPISKF